MKYVATLSAFTLALTNATVAQQCPATVTDVEGYVYQVLQYNTQCWLGENLRVTQFRNGDDVPLLAATLNLLSTGDNPAMISNPAGGNNHEIFGWLYNHAAATDPRGLCPEGWHLPTDEEWMVLETLWGIPVDQLEVIGNARGVQAQIGAQVKGGAEHWIWQGTNAPFPITNTTGFTGLPPGAMEASTQIVMTSVVGSSTRWWTPEGNSRRLGHDLNGVGRQLHEGAALRSAFSVRCVWDQSVSGTAIPERDAALGLAAYPNPSHDVFTVELSADEPVPYWILDGLGRVVGEGQLRGGRTDIDLSHLDAGRYMLRVPNGTIALHKL